MNDSSPLKRTPATKARLRRIALFCKLIALFLFKKPYSKFSSLIVHCRILRLEGIVPVGLLKRRKVL